MAVVGDMAKQMRFQGEGSSYINPIKLVSPADVLTETVSVEEADVAIVFAGLTPDYESEGFDRDNMEMPSAHIKMIEDTAAKNPNTVVVLFCGAPVETPWADKVKAILYMGLPGQAGGEAVKNLLYGKANPSGKLAETWPKEYKDCASSGYYGPLDAQYREGIYVGYRYYDKAGVKPQWRFGYGLSYTQFEYSNAAIDGDRVSVTVTNSGSREGAEVVQLYVCPPQDGIYRPLRELKRFAKVWLQPGESASVSFELDERCFAVWDDGWKVPSGTYTILVGGNPDSLINAGTIEKAVENVNIPEWQTNSWYEKPVGAPSQDEWERMLGRKYTLRIARKGEFTLNDTVSDMKEHSVAMRMLNWGLKKYISRVAKPGTSEYRMMIESSAGSPLRSLQITGGVNANVVKGLLEMANGRFFRGLKLVNKI